MDLKILVGARAVGVFVSWWGEAPVASAKAAHKATGLSGTRFGVQCEPTERLDYVVSPLRRRKRDPPVTPKSKLDEPLRRW